MTDEEMLRANAELVVEIASAELGLQLGYDEEGVAWADGFIERQRDRARDDEDYRSRLISVLGGFLGECIRQTYGGSWSLEDDGWGIRVNPGFVAFPLNKTAKHFENDDGDSILEYFRVIGPMLRHPHLFRD